MSELISQISFYYWSAALHNETFSATPTKPWWVTDRQTTYTAPDSWKLWRSQKRLMKSIPEAWRTMEYCSKEDAECTSTITTALRYNREHQTAPGLMPALPACVLWPAGKEMEGAWCPEINVQHLKCLSKRIFFHNIFIELYQTNYYATWNGFRPSIKCNLNDPFNYYFFVQRWRIFMQIYVSLCIEDILNCAETTANLIKVCHSKHKID